jgi:hypothetical protein
MDCSTLPRAPLCEVTATRPERPFAIESQFGMKFMRAPLRMFASPAQFRPASWIELRRAVATIFSCSTTRPENPVSANPDA